MMTNCNYSTTPSVLIIQENGRHEHNRQFRECFCLQRAFSHLGVTADIWGKNHTNFHIPFEDLAGNYDFILSLENYDSNWHPDLSRIQIPKAFWCIDAHMGIGPYLNFARANRFDIIFNATEAYVDRFRKYTGTSIWLPNAYDSFLIDKLFNIKKEVPLGFCGNIVNRKEWIEHLKLRWGLHHDEMVIGDDMVRAINSYQIHWNKNIADDINYRTFETLGCCTFLLTNYTPGIEKLFTPGEHLVVYNDRNDLDQKIAYYQKNSDEREKIAKSGYIHVKQNHKYIHRARQVLSAVGIKNPSMNLNQAPKEVLQGIPDAKENRKYVAQYNEEEILWRFFKNKRNGFLVDVGAADGYRYSNSYSLINDYNWGGMLIEPHPDFVQRTETLYAEKPKIKICAYAIGSTEEIRQLYMYGRDKHAQISTLSNRFKERAVQIHGDKYLSPINVKCKPLNSVLREYDCPIDIDFISIDCEGLDMEVLQSMDWNRYHVRLVCVEHSMPKSDLHSYMNSIGYTFFDETIGNSFFVKDGRYEI
jgi:FkbM family methyltransferase